LQFFSKFFENALHSSRSATATRPVVAGKGYRFYRGEHLRGHAPGFFVRGQH
jgi:hypothetical protein